jgi:hypothetical protein
MKGQHQGIRSTKQKALDHLVESDKIVKIKVEPGTEVPLPAKRFNDIFVCLEDLAESIHSDQTAAFLYTSQRGNRYVMIAIHLDGNYIFCESIKNRTEGEMIKAYQKIINRMKTAGLGLKPHQLDNKVSTAYKECIHHNGMIHKLVPPDNHRSNLAERSILHLNTERSGRQIPTVTVVCSPRADRTHREPPPAIQRRTKNIGVCPHARPARLHEEAICANWVRSPSTRQPTNRRTWDTHTEAGYNLGTSMEHHRCFKIYVPKTRATRVSNMVFFKHQYKTNPVVSPESLVVAAAQQLTTALKRNIPAGNETAEALKKVSDLFTKIAEAKAAVAKAKVQRNRLRTYPKARRAIPLPRVAEQNPRVEMAIPRVDETPKADCCVVQTVANQTTPRFNAQSLEISSSAARPNYISQDEGEDEVPPQGYNRRSQTMNIFQEAMLACVDISKPTYVVSQDLGMLNYTDIKKPVFEIAAKQLSSRRIPMTWL